MKKSLTTDNQLPDLSIIVLYYNSGHYLDLCLDSLSRSILHSYRLETIVVNNGATDGIVLKAQKKYRHNPLLNLKVAHSPTNLGFSAGNNFGLKATHPGSKYILFVNDDTTFAPDAIFEMLEFFKKYPQADAATGYVTLASTNLLAPESHRGFPTPWNTFWHFFGLGIPRLFPHSQLFHGYLCDYKDYQSVEKIDCCQGCFLMVKRRVGNTIGWWNEKYFFLGEDLDFCYQLKKNHFNLYFNPTAKITHFHGVSSGLQKTKSPATRSSRVRSALASTNAMRIFYRENLLSHYPRPLHWLIWLGIKLLEIQRLFKAKYL